MHPNNLPLPAKYYPWKNGKYEIAPGLRPFGTDFGNGNLDQILFQFDCEFERYRRTKLQSIEEAPLKYRVKGEISPSQEAHVTHFIVERLLLESPELFSLKEGKLECALTGENIAPDLNSLALQIQEDFAIVSTDGTRDWISAINVCAPSHWAPEEKVNVSFFDNHTVVPGFEKVNAVAGSMVDAMVHKGPFVRFVWGVESDDRLNHHPVPPAGWDFEEWQGRDFLKGVVARVERQVIWGLPEIGCAFFSIRVGFVRQEELVADPALSKALLQAVATMSPAARTYKGIGESWELAAVKVLNIN